MLSYKAPCSLESYTIAWISALPVERAAAEAMLDEEHTVPTSFIRHESDANIYTWGRIGKHNIVIVSSSSSSFGLMSSAITASSLLASLPTISIGLLVGIGSGIAKPDQDIRLGDVVVSQPSGISGGVRQYDFIKAKSNGRSERLGFLGRPPIVLLNALGEIQAEHERKDSKITSYLQEMLEKNPKMASKDKNDTDYSYQGVENDVLHKATSHPTYGADCCAEVQRDYRDTTNPKIHYGTIASGQMPVNNAQIRDRIFAELGEDCLCFETAAAGLMNHFPCLVIRGICDYADSHSNDKWHKYASATAAAYAKEILQHVPATEVQETKKTLEVLQSAQEQIESLREMTLETKLTTTAIVSHIDINNIRQWLCPPDPSTNANKARKLRHEGTGAWLVTKGKFKSWSSGLLSHLWLRGIAGCGKTVISATAIDTLVKNASGVVLSFFFDSSDSRKQDVDDMLRSLACQIDCHDKMSSTVHLGGLYHAYNNGNDQPTTKALSNAINTMLKMFRTKRRVFIVLDALDESNTRGDTLQWIEDVINEPELAHVHIFCTSRPVSDFNGFMPSLVGAENCVPFDYNTVNNDIKAWVATQLSQRHEFKRKNLSPDIRNKILTKVGEGAGGMFRWASCQLDALARCHHETAMEEVLVSLPIELEEAYRYMITGISVDMQDDAIRLLQFLVHSKWPVPLSAVKEIIATRINDNYGEFDRKRRLFRDIDILDYCPGLIKICDAPTIAFHPEPKTDGRFGGIAGVNIEKVVDLTHFSVKEFLLRDVAFEFATSHASITLTCLSYLTVVSNQNENDRKDFTMAKYAAKIWTHHARLAMPSDEIEMAACMFLEGEKTFQTWTRLYHADNPSIATTGPLFGSRLCYASLCGLLVPVKHLLSTGEDVNARGGTYGTALQAASAAGHQEIVEVLLQEGADVNAEGGVFGSALRAASSSGHRDTVKLLLKKGADVNIGGGQKGNIPEDAFYFPEIYGLLLAAQNKGSKRY